MKKALMLRGAINMLSRAINYVGTGHRVDEWGDGHYLDPAIESADSILRNALWHIEYDFRKLK